MSTLLYLLRTSCHPLPLPREQTLNDHLRPSAMPTCVDGSPVGCGGGGPFLPVGLWSFISPAALEKPKAGVGNGNTFRDQKALQR